MTIPPQRVSGKGRGRRLRGLIRKEFLQIVRDPSSIAIAFVMPVVLLLLFGYGVSLNATNVPVAVVLEKPGPEAYGFTARLQGSKYFHPIIIATMQQAQHALIHRRVDGIVCLRSTFARDLTRPGGASIQVVLNGIDANNARLVSGYVQNAWEGWATQRAAETGQPSTFSVHIDQRVWFNSEVRSRNFLVPGLIAVIMTLIGALLTALVVAREWERGTMEALLVTPVRIPELLLGKLIPYYLLGMGGMMLSVLMAVFLFQVPLRGSMAFLFLASSLFLLAALGMGMLISTVTKNQFVAGQVAIITTFLPAFILSGFIFDISSMPRIIQLITHVLAARYFVAILHTVFLAGDVWPVLWPNALALLVMVFIFLGLTRLKSRKRLE